MPETDAVPEQPHSQSEGADGNEQAHIDGVAKQSPAEPGSARGSTELALKPTPPKKHKHGGARAVLYHMMTLPHYISLHAALDRRLGVPHSRPDRGTQRDFARCALL